MNDLAFVKKYMESPLIAFSCSVLVMLSGLPGSGKTYFSRQLAKSISITLLESDFIRKTLVPQPVYTGAENARVFRTSYALAEELLTKGMPVLFDATNLVRRNRKRLYKIATTTKAKLIILEMSAPEQVIVQRLGQRIEELSPRNYSDADISVYRRLSATAQPILRDHLTVSTDQDIMPAVDALAKDIARRIGSPLPGNG
jgi:predicted kinase